MNGFDKVQENVVQPKASRTSDLLATGHLKVAGKLNSHGRMTKARRLSNRAERRCARQWMRVF